MCSLEFGWIVAEGKRVAAAWTDRLMGRSGSNVGARSFGLSGHSSPLDHVLHHCFCIDGAWCTGRHQFIAALFAGVN